MSEVRRDLPAAVPPARQPRVVPLSSGVALEVYTAPGRTRVLLHRPGEGVRQQLYYEKYDERGGRYEFAENEME
jgi:hypothetical protein